MLFSLYISNVALIDEMQVNFQPGLNVLSGETGAGKSIILSSLMFLLGGKSIVDLVRAGSSRCIVEGMFRVGHSLQLQEQLTEAGIEIDDSNLLIRRELDVSGKSKVFINGRPTTHGMLKRFRPFLVDIHGQSDQQSLLDPSVQLNVFDEFALASPHRKAVNDIYDEILQVVKSLKAINRDEHERVQALDFINFQIQEIEQASVLSEDEDVRLEEERRILLNAERLATLTSEAYSYLAEDEYSIVSRLAALHKKIKDLLALDSTFERYSERLEECTLVLDDLAYFLSSYHNRIEASPARLAFIDDRLQELTRLKHKYGGMLRSVSETFDLLVDRRDKLLNSGMFAENLQEKLEELLARYKTEATQLRETRAAKMAEFEEKVKREFAEVSTHPPHFSVVFLPIAASVGRDVSGVNGENLLSSYSREGTERVGFYFSANPGEPLRPLNETASGGELSRLMLAIKTVLSPTGLSRTLVFDEVDSGIGGAIADAVGRRLKRLAANNQVLCVTHQAHLAKYADAHFLVTKEGDPRMNTKVKHLTSQERVKEMARMIGGNRITEIAKKHAQELLSTASTPG